MEASDDELRFHLAQINIGTLVAPPGDPAVAEFMLGLDRINAVADAAPGFVWRLQAEDGNATSIAVFDDPRTVVNMSVWTSIDALREYAYRSEHVEFFRRRSEWFERDGKRVALWWIPAGSIPTVAEGVRQVEYLEANGSSARAFDFARPEPTPMNGV